MNKGGLCRGQIIVFSVVMVCLLLAALVGGGLGSSINSAHYTLTVYPWDPFALQKVLPTTATSQFPSGDHVLVKGCRGEFEPASFIVHAAEPLDAVTVEAGDLRSSDGRIIPVSMIDVRLVKCWYQAGEGTINNTGKKVLTPELLLKDDGLVKVDYLTRTNYLRVTVSGREKYADISSEYAALPPLALFDDSPSLLPFSLPAGNNKQVWVTVRIPDKATPGMYQGNLAVRIAGKAVAVMGLQLEVLPFDLAEPLVDYGIYYRGILSQQLVSKVSSENKTSIQYRAELKDMYDHGIQYPTLYQSVDDPFLNQALEIRDQFAFRKDRLFTLGTTTGNKTNLQGLQRLDKQLAIWEKLAAQHGYRTVYIYGIDEAVGERLNAQRPSWEVVHKRGMKMFTAVYEGAVNTAGDILDLPILSGYKPQEVERWHGKGKRVYCYGNPQVGIEDPLIYRENYGFRLWLGGYDGCMPYAYQHGLGDIWNDFDDPGFRDHVFAYPTRTGVIDTIEWEGFREAVEDARYLATAMGVAGNEVSSFKTELQALPAGQRINVKQIRSRLIERILSHVNAANRYRR